MICTGYSIDNAVFYTLVVDVVGWIGIFFLFTNPNEQMHQLLSLCFTPAGPLYMLCVFLPQQFLFISALGTRRDAPFHAVFYASFLLVLFTGLYTYHSWTNGITSNSYNTTMGSKTISVPQRTTCSEWSLPGTLLFAYGIICVVILLFRQKHDRISCKYRDMASWACRLTLLTVQCFLLFGLPQH